jgi:hypothetical protein
MWIAYALYVIRDNFSRYLVGRMIAAEENATLALPETLAPPHRPGSTRRPWRSGTSSTQCVPSVSQVIDDLRSTIPGRRRRGERAPVPVPVT